MTPLHVDHSRINWRARKAETMRTLDRLWAARDRRVLVGAEDQDRARGRPASALDSTPLSGRPAGAARRVKGKASMSTAEFLALYAALAEHGHCDSAGGMEYRRVVDEWLQAGRPEDAVNFIKRRANVFPAADGTLMEGQVGPCAACDAEAAGNGPV